MRRSRGRRRSFAAAASTDSGIIWKLFATFFAKFHNCFLSSSAFVFNIYQNGIFELYHNGIMMSRVFWKKTKKGENDGISSKGIEKGTEDITAEACF
jgi:hypothetical protein